ncbi:hypothetical protein JCM10213_004203 [Rhodosporidiobolus nylandii]
MFAGITSALGLSTASSSSSTPSDTPAISIVAEPETTSVAFPALNSQQRAKPAASTSSPSSAPALALSPPSIDPPAAEEEAVTLPEVKIDGSGAKAASSLAPPGGRAGASSLAPPTSTVGVVKAPKGRVRVEKGFSQLDWARLNRKGDVDLRGGVTELRRITPSEVARHNTEEDCWQVYEGKVYNVGPFLRYHPGGGEEMMRAAGKDVLAHAWVNYEALLENCLVGFLVGE